jgi:replicative DNA helicase
MIVSVENLVLNNLATNEEFSRRALPFIKPEYFGDEAQKLTFEIISEFVTKHTTLPSREALLIELDAKTGQRQDTVDRASQLIDSMEKSQDPVDFLLEKAETFCQDKAIINGIHQAIQILDDKKGEVSRGAIPKILSDALAVSFDTNIGHDFLEDAESRYEFYHRTENKIPWRLSYLNKVTKGGIPRKTLSCIMAPTGVGKTIFMCDDACFKLEQGMNVLYITLEMAEERIAERIDANLLDVTLDDLAKLPRDMYLKKMENARKKTTGKLIIKEYPTASAGAAHFRYLLNDLKLKKNFVPDVIYIDYLNICASSRIKLGSNVNSYSYVKAIAEELRGLAIEFDVAIYTATQTNRSGYDNSDIDMTDTSESIGLPMTLDFFGVLIATDELEQMGQIMFKQLKNRFGPIDGKNKRFILGIDRPKMRFFDVDDKAQAGLMEEPSAPARKKPADTPAFDKGNFGSRLPKPKGLGNLEV